MKIVSRLVCLSALVLLLCSVPALAADWTSLGERTVDLRANSASIPVAAGAGALGKLRFEMESNVLQLLTVKVTFADGQVFDAHSNAFLGNGRSADIDLPSAKEIAKVDFTYRKSAATDRTHAAPVKLLGTV